MCLSGEEARAWREKARVHQAAALLRELGRGVRVRVRVRVLLLVRVRARLYMRARVRES